MDAWYTLGLAFGLAMDAFAVAIAAGLASRELSGRHVFRLAFHFGLFQFLMPVVGWLAGQTLQQRIAVVDHWLAFTLLAFIGVKMIRESFGSEGGDKERDPTRGWSLVHLSVATSIDALAVGLSLAFLGSSIVRASVVIGLVAAGMTAFGIMFGNRIGARFGRWAERAGGAVLLGIGARILLTHLRAP
jgi:manganese efflux pump family protein